MPERTMMPDKDHPFWKIVPYVCVTVFLCCWLMFGYKNGFDSVKDVITIIGAILAFAGGSVAPTLFSRPADK